MLSEKSISGAVSMQGKRCIAPAERIKGSAVSLLFADLINLTDALYDCLRLVETLSASGTAIKQIKTVKQSH